MVGGCQGCGEARSRLFYEKKIDPAVKVMLLGDILNADIFLEWWSKTELQNDFWLETNDKLVRVHITPRKNFFDPRDWRTSQGL